MIFLLNKLKPEHLKGQRIKSAILPRKNGTLNLSCPEVCIYGSSIHFKAFFSQSGVNPGPKFEFALKPHGLVY